MPSFLNLFLVVTVLLPLNILLLPLYPPFFLFLLTIAFPTNAARCDNLLRRLMISPDTMNCDNGSGIEGLGPEPTVNVLFDPTVCSCSNNNDDDFEPPLEVVPEGLVRLSRRVRALARDEGAFVVGEGLGASMILELQSENQTGQWWLLVESVDHSTSFLGDSCRAEIQGFFDCECEVCEDKLTFNVDCSQQTFPDGVVGAGLPGPKFDSCVNFAFLSS